MLEIPGTIIQTGGKVVQGFLELAAQLRQVILFTVEIEGELA